MAKKSLPQDAYVMSEESANRLMNRYSHMDVLRNTTEAKSDFGNKNKKLKQAMYLHPVGQIPENVMLGSSNDYSSENVEQHLEKAILYQDADQLMEKRNEFIVIEDDFGPTLEKMMKDGEEACLERLIAACKSYDTSESIDLHTKKSNATHRYFLERGVSKDDAKAYAFALAFYTGSYSWAISMEANTLCRRKTNSEM
jgi:hypothetical protein